MKNFYFFIFCFFLAILPSRIYSQSADVIEGCVPLTVKFTGANGLSAYYWDFKDLASANIANPSHIFSSAGTYNVELKEGANGKSIGTVTINVYETPQIQLTANKTKGCIPLSVSFSVNTVNPLPNGVTGVFNWTFGDGANDNAKTNTSHTYNSANTFDLGIALVTNLPTCNKTFTYDKYISTSNKPNVTYSTTPSSPTVCVGPLNVSFQNNSTSTLPLTYAWDFGNTNTSTKVNGDPQTYTTDGVYPVKLTATDSNNCSNSITKNMSVGNPKASFVVKDTVCIGQSGTVLLSNQSSSGAYQWTFDTGTSIATSTSTNPSVYFSTPGNHTITLKVTASGGSCFDDTIRTIYVEDPTVTITSSPSYSCHDTMTSFYSANSAAKIASYNWYFKSPFATPSSSNVSNPKCFYNTYDTTYHYRKQTVFKDSLVIITTSGCTASAIHNDTIYEMWARIFPDKHQGCINELTVTFADSSTSHLKKPIKTWEWDFGDGTKQTVNTFSTPSHTYTTAGIYNPKLIIKDGFGCSDTSYFLEIKVGSKQNLSFTANPTSICPGESVQLTNTTPSNIANLIDSWHYNSDKEHISHCADIDEPNIVFNDSVGTHTIRLTGEYNGCQSFAYSSIDVKGPIADFDYILDCKNPLTILLINKSQGATSVTWDLGETTITNMQDTNSYTFATSGTKKILMTAVNATSGCTNHKDSADVYVGSIQSNLTLTDVDGNPTDLVNSKNIIDGSSPYLFDGSTSTGVYTFCFRGYSFITEKGDRPNTYSTAKDTFLLSTSGDQFVGMVVRNENNCVDTLLQNVRVINSTADFDMLNKKTNLPVSQVCLPVTINFTDISTSDTTITNWNWVFSDGQTSNQQNPGDITFTNGSIELTATLTITNKVGFTREITQKIPIYAPSATITSSPAKSGDNKVHICHLDDVTFTANSVVGNGLTYQWIYTDNQKNTGNNSTHKFIVKGNSQEENDSVKLIFTEPSTGCKDSVNQVVNIQKKPTPKITTNSSDSTYCNPFSVTFYDTSSFMAPNSSALWTLTSNQTSVGDSTSYTYKKGNQNVKLKITTSNGCSDETTFSFEVVGPEGSFTFDKNDICKGESITFALKDTTDVADFTWDFGDGITVKNQNPVTHSYYFLPPNGSTKATLKLEGKNGQCAYAPDTLIYIKQVIADFTRTDLGSGVLEDTVICLNNSVSFQNTSLNADVFKWDLGNGTSSVSIDINSVTYDKVDTFNITLYASSSSLGCKDTITLPVIVKNLPSASVIPETICLGIGNLKLQITDTNSNYTYEWQNTDKNPSTTSFYSIKTTDNIDNCIHYDSALMIVVQPIQAIDFIDTIVIGDGINLPIDNQYGSVLFDWTPEKGLSCLQCPNPYVHPLADTTYLVHMHDSLGCFEENGKFTIIVKPNTHIKLPTTFTPNGDGNNDIVYVKGWGIKKLISFEIYNRWGELLYKSDNINEGWNGYFKDVLQNNDVYAYKVVAVTFSADATLSEEQKTITKEGYIHLMR